VRYLLKGIVGEGMAEFEADEAISMLVLASEQFDFAEVSQPFPHEGIKCVVQAEVSVVIAVLCAELCAPSSDGCHLVFIGGGYGVLPCDCNAGQRYVVGML